MFRSRRFSAGHRGPNKNKAVQGTQQTAQSHMESNRKHFKYPEEGFVTPIEHSLLYAMIMEPTIYPLDVIRQAIHEQDFDEFLIIKNTRRKSAAVEGEEEICSYAQLSALLSLAMQKWPPSKDKENPQDNVPQLLCQALLRTVIHYAQKHDLDREHEIAEFLNPAVERTKQRLDNAANAKMNLPFYLGIGLSLATANPLPMYLAYAAGTASFLKDDVVTKEGVHLEKVANQSRRSANVETASLMDEMEDD